MAEILPDPPFELPAEPMAIIQAMIPGRIIPTLIPRFSSLLSKIEVKTHEYIGTYADGTPLTIPAITLVPKLITSSVSPEDDMHEFYVLMRDGDPDAFLDFWAGPTVPEGLVACGIARMCGAAVDIFYDGNIVKSFPELSEIGYFGFTIVTASGEMLKK